MSRFFERTSRPVSPFPLDDRPRKIKRNRIKLPAPPKGGPALPTKTPAVWTPISSWPGHDLATPGVRYLFVPTEVSEP